VQSLGEVNLIFLFIIKTHQPVLLHFNGLVTEQILHFFVWSRNYSVMTMKYRSHSSQQLGDNFTLIFRKESCL